MRLLLRLAADTGARRGVPRWLLVGGPEDVDEGADSGVAARPPTLAFCVSWAALSGSLSVVLAAKRRRDQNQR